MKLREFWITAESFDHLNGSQLRYCVDKDPKGFDIHPEQFIHVREVMPIDWEKVWNYLDNWSGCSIEVSNKHYLDKLKELIEKQLAGEL